MSAPRLADSLGFLECQVRQTLEIGDHVLFIGQATLTVYRSEGPRLHHLDVRLAATAATFEAARPGAGQAHRG